MRTPKLILTLAAWLSLGAAAPEMVVPKPSRPQDLVYPNGEIRIDADSASRAKLTESQLHSVLSTANRYLQQIDAGDFEAARAAWAPAKRPDLMVLQSRLDDGPVLSRELASTVWRTDSPGQAPGLYVGVNYTAVYERAGLVCGYLVLHETEANRFSIVKELTASVSNEVRDNRRSDPVAFEGAWKSLEAECVNLPPKPSD